MSRWLDRRKSQESDEQSLPEGTFRPFSYGPGRGCLPLLPTSTDRVLGRLPDGWWEVEVVRLSPQRVGVEVTMRNGSLLHVEHLDQRGIGLLKKATGFSRPAGGIAVVLIKNGSLSNVKERRDDELNCEEEDSVEHH